MICAFQHIVPFQQRIHGLALIAETLALDFPDGCLAQSGTDALLGLEYSFIVLILSNIWGSVQIVGWFRPKYPVFRIDRQCLLEILIPLLHKRETTPARARPSQYQSGTKTFYAPLGLIFTLGVHKKSVPLTHLFPIPPAGEDNNHRIVSLVTVHFLGD